MVVTLETSQIGIRACILFQVKQKKEIEEVYENICNVIGKDCIEYTEFEYWYYRFYNGDHDLDHDRSLDPKTRKFTEMSADAIQHVMGYLKKQEWFKFRHICHSLRNIFDDKWFPGSYKIKISWYKGGISTYLVEKNRFEKAGEKSFKYSIPVKTVPDDIIFMVMNTKLNFEKLEFHLDLPIGTNMVVKDISHKVHVKAVSGKLKILALILPCMKAEALERIGLYGAIKDDGLEVLNRIFVLDQWKKAKELQCEVSKWFLDSISHLRHFTRLMLFVKVETTQDMVIPMKFILQNFQNLEMCRLFIRQGQYRTLDLWNNTDFLHPNNSNDPFIRHYPIPNSNEFYEVSFDDFSPLGDIYFPHITENKIFLDYFQIERKH